MRRFLFSLLAVGFLGALVGCTTSHGVCDCAWDTDDHCTWRQPWVNHGAGHDSHAVPNGGHNGHNGHIPEVKEVVPVAPKKL